MVWIPSWHVIPKKIAIDVVSITLIFVTCGLDKYHFCRTFGIAGHHCIVTDFGHRFGLGKSAILRCVVRRYVCLFCRHIGRAFRAVYRPADAKLCRKLREKGYRIIKAISVSSEEDIRKTEAYESAVDYFLFDTRCTGYGGSGQTFDWSILKHYEGQTPFLLSGGIRLELLPQLLRFNHPQLIGFDLNSGFESAPGLKDAKRIQSFINQLKQTNV